MTRSYSVADIKRMRAATEVIMRTRMMPDTIYMDGEIHFTTAEEIEARLNTFVTAGINPADIEAEAIHIEAKWSEIWTRHMNAAKGRVE